MNSPNLKYRADYLHDGTGFIEDRVLVLDAEGTIRDLVPTSEAGDDIRRIRGLLCPGFVNAHCHLELSHMRDVISEHTGLVDFLIAVMGARSQPEGVITEAAFRAEAEMQQAGIVAVGDISNTAGTLALKTQGRIHYHTFIEAIGLKDQDADLQMERSLKMREAFTQNGLEASVVPHAPYSVSGSLMRQLNRVGSQNIISIHNQESPEENKLFQGRQSGFQRLYQALGQEGIKIAAPADSSLKAWLPCFTEHQPVIAVHNTFTSGADIRFTDLTEHRVYWCLCPRANLYIENCLPPVELLVAEGARIVLGTDSLASNHGLSILEEIRVLTRSFPSLQLEKMLGWATSGGAEALGITTRFGQFRTGTRPGILQLYPLAEESGAPAISPLTKVSRLK